MRPRRAAVRLADTRCCGADLACHQIFMHHLRARDPSRVRRATSKECDYRTPKMKTARLAGGFE